MLDAVLTPLVGALLLAIVLTMIFGELYPKKLAIASPEPLARALAMPTRIYLLVLGWLISIFDLAANALLKLLRIEPLEDVDESATARDLGAIIEESRASGDLPDDLSMIIDRILDFPQRAVEHAMVPRSRIDCIGPETTVGEIRTLMATGHTRYPVIGAEDDPVDVVDEYGNFDGILTIEDLTEEVIGEISDEHDIPEKAAETVQGIRMQRWLDVEVLEVARHVPSKLAVRLLRHRRVRAPRRAPAPPRGGGGAQRLGPRRTARHERAHGHARLRPAGHHRLHLPARCDHEAGDRLRPRARVRAVGVAGRAGRRHRVRAGVDRRHLPAPGHR